MSLNKESITFGKYNGTTLSRVLRDREYCKWLINEDWFQKNYEYLYNRIKEYNPKIYFLNPSLELDFVDGTTVDNYLDNYIYFNLTQINDLKIDLDTPDKICYEYYLRMIDEIKNSIYERLENEEENPFDIKAPTKWLQRFERECCMPRDNFKNFINAYELPNIPYIIEHVKKQGGISYLGACSYKIAKARSEEQEKWWYDILKNRYGEKISSQFKYEKCIFDFVNISTKTIFEVKLALKDFDEAQHSKYKKSLKEFRIIYLISRDCVIDMEKKSLYTTDRNKYEIYQLKIPELKHSSYLDELIKTFEIIDIQDLSTLFG